MDYTELILRAPAAQAETVSAIAELAADSFYLEDYTDLADCEKNVYFSDELLNKDKSTGIWHLYLDDAAGAEAARSLLNERLQAAGIPHEIAFTCVKGADWENSWKQFYKPFYAASGVLVCPVWERPSPKDGDIVISINPGMAFGSGTHETTRLVIGVLTESIAGGEYLLDMGCGSGIFAIAALKLGAARAVAADISGEAIKMTAENAELNSLSDRLTVMEAHEAERLSGFSIITANIVADVIIGYADFFASALIKGGRLIASGIISGREQETADALSAAGLTLIKGSREKEWNAMVFQK